MSDVDTITVMVIALVLDTPGVARLTDRKGSGKAGESSRAKNAKPSKSVRVMMKDSAVSINARVIAAYGKPIPETARRIQDEIKKQVNERFPHLTLTAVNVWVDGVSFD